MKIREIYEESKQPVAIVDANSYVLWANSAAKQEFPELFKRNGLRELARFSDERMLISRLVKNGIGATIHPRQSGYDHMIFTFTPLPDVGKEMLLTLSEDKRYSHGDTGFGTGVVACAVPTIREITSRVCENLDMARSLDGKEAEKVFERAADCCGELVGEMERISLFSELLAGRRPDLAVCNTALFFSELSSSITDLLQERAPLFEIEINEDVVMDHNLMGRALLFLISNVFEHGYDRARVNIRTLEDSFVIEISNKVKYEEALSGETAIRPFVSFTDGEFNNKIGIGLTLAQMAAKSHKGSVDVTCEDGFYTVCMKVPIGVKTRKTHRVEVKNKASYLEDRFSPVVTELKKYAEKK